jgi:hypothetical protein
VDQRYIQSSATTRENTRRAQETARSKSPLILGIKALLTATSGHNHGAEETSRERSTSRGRMTTRFAHADTSRSTSMVKAGGKKVSNFQESLIQFKNLQDRIAIYHEILSTRDRMNKHAVLDKLVFRTYTQKVFHYFMRWKLLTRMSAAELNMHLKKTLKVRGLMKLATEQFKRMVRSSLYVWKFQVDQGFQFPKLRKKKAELSTRIEKDIVKRVIDRVNLKILEVSKKKQSFSIHEFYVLLDKLAWMIQQKFTQQFRTVWRRFRVLTETERCVVQNNQSILIRTLSLNLVLFNKMFGKDGERVDLPPRTILSIMEGSARIREKQMKVGYLEAGNKNYYDRFLEKAAHYDFKDRDAHVLIRGIWATPDPVFRLRDFYMVKLFQRNYIKWMNIIFFKLKFHKNLTIMIEKRRNELETDNNKFRKTWSRLLLVNSINDKLEILCLKSLLAFESFRKKQAIDKLGKIGNNIAQASSTSRELFLRTSDAVDAEEVLRESFKKRHAEARKNFPKHVLLTILRPGIASKQIQSDLTKLLIDTMYFITCGAARDVNGVIAAKTGF